MNRSTNGFKLKKKRVIGVRDKRVKRYDMELELSDLGESREESGNELRLSRRDGRMRSDEGKLAVMTEESGSQSEKGNKMAHTSTWEQSNMGEVAGGLIGS